MDLNTELANTLSTYNFEQMVELCKKGAKPVDIILHRVINRDRVDLLDFFLFSSELAKNIPLHYKYELFGKTPALPYACLCCAINCVEYLVNNSKTCNEFNYKEITQSCLGYACEGGSYEVMEFLLTHEKTKNFCSVTNKFLDHAIERKRLDFLEKMILNFDVGFMETFINNSQVFATSEKMKELNFKELFQKRILKEDLDSNLPTINKNNSFKKI